MFEVTYRGDVYTVYNVNVHSGVTEFLIFDDNKFKWVNMSNCKLYREVY